MQCNAILRCIRKCGGPIPTHKWRSKKGIDIMFVKPIPKHFRVVSHGCFKHTSNTLFNHLVIAPHVSPWIMRREHRHVTRGHCFALFTVGILLLLGVAIVVIVVIIIILLVLGVAIVIIIILLVLGVVIVVIVIICFCCHRHWVLVMPKRIFSRVINFYWWFYPTCKHVILVIGHHLFE